MLNMYFKWVISGYATHIPFDVLGYITPASFDTKFESAIFIAKYITAYGGTLSVLHNMLCLRIPTYV